MPSPISLDGRAWELGPDIASASVGAVLARARVLDTLGPSGLLGYAALSCSVSRKEASDLLVDQFGFDRGRARASVGLAQQLRPADATNQPVGQLAGVKVAAAQAKFVAGLVRPVDGSSRLPAPDVSTAEAARLWRQHRIQHFVKLAVRSGDSSAALVGAALLAANRGNNDFVARLTEAQFHTLMGRGTQQRRQVGRVLGAAYALAAVDPAGFDLGHTRVQLGTAGWRMRAAPWVLPILDEENGRAVHALLSAVDARSLDFVSPGVNALPYPDQPRVFSDTLAAAAAYASRLTKWSDRPLWFDGGPGAPQVLLTQDDETFMYAWVGSDAKGVLVAFDTEHLVGYGLDEPGVRAALAHALGWFIDVSISLRVNPAGSAGIRRAATGSARSGVRYVPTPTYSGQVQDVAGGRNRPPRIHAVQSHLRRLVKKKPRTAARERAPRRLRDLMGPNDTFVRGYLKGGQAAAVLDTRLSTYSMLADVIGLHEASDI